MYYVRSVLDMCNWAVELQCFRNLWIKFIRFTREFRMELLVSFLVSDLRNGSDGLFAGAKSHIIWINTSLNWGLSCESQRDEEETSVLYILDPFPRYARIIRLKCIILIFYYYVKYFILILLFLQFYFSHSYNLFCKIFIFVSYN